jgi:mannitol operon transcriptional antiterminator
MQLTCRQASILYELLQSDVPLSASLLASRLDLNERIVRFNLPALDLWLHQHGIQDKLQSPKGIYLKISTEMREQLRDNLTLPQHPQRGIYLRPEYRQLWIAFRVLESTQPLHSQHVEQDLELSENTLVRDFEQVESMLEKHALTLVRKRSVGTYVEGSEIQIRYALSILIKRILGEANIVNLCLWKKVELQNPWTEISLLRRMTLEILNSWSPWEAWSSINHLTSNLGISYDEVNISRIALYLAISVNRIRNGRSVIYPSTRIEDIRENEIFKAIQKMLKNPGFAPEISLSESEIAYLFNQLVTYHYAGFGNEYEHLGDVSLDSFLPIAEEIMGLVYQARGLSFTPSSVTRDLAAHLHRCYHLLLLGVRVHFELSEDVRACYPELNLEVDRVTRQISVNPLLATILKEETGRITLYVAMAIMLDQSPPGGQESKIVVVCPTGGVTSRMLMLRLRTELPELGNLELMSIKQLSSSDLKSVLAIISTTESILGAYDLPVIVVSPLLKPADIIKLRTWLLNRS